MKGARIVGVVVVAAMMLGAVPAMAAGKVTYKKICTTRDGILHFVLIPKAQATKRPAYLKAIQELCSPVRAQQCRLYYWTDPKTAPKTCDLPLTDKEAGAIMVSYGRARDHVYQDLAIIQPGLVLVDK